MFNGYLDLLAYFGIGGAHPGGFSLTQVILDDEIILPFTSVLDVGCGTGQTAAYLAQRFECKVTAIDNHSIMLEKARDRFKNNGLHVKLIEGDVQNLELVDNSFDLIIAESVITFTDISKTLKEFSRVLKRNGRLIMIEMTAEQYVSEEIQSKVCSLYGITEVLNEEEWTFRLQQAGFTKIEMLNTPSDLLPNEMIDINQSENIDISLYDLWDEHNNFIKQTSQFIGFRAFRCRLN